MNLKEKLGLCWRILKQKPGGLVAHALRELPTADDEMQALMNAQLIELITVFSTHGHSGFSAGYATSALEKLLAYEPLRPLTGEESEWMEVSDGLWQNKRCSRIFKDKSRFDGQAYDIEAKVFREPNGSCYTSWNSHTPITFPYIPKREYVDVPGDVATA